MEQPVKEIYQTLQNLVGLHRQLLETVRVEKEAIAAADLKTLQEATYTKAALIESVRQCEAERIKLTIKLAAIWKVPVQELTLPQIILRVQGTDLKSADLFRSVHTALNTLIQRVAEQNRYNQNLVEKSLSHIREMKSNVLGEASAKSETYTPYGKKNKTQTQQSRLLSKEV